MRSILMLVCLTILASCTAQSSFSIEQIDWLEGNWERTDLKAENKGYEVWTYENSSMIGVGISMSGSDTTFIEKLKIETIDDALFYRADVPNNAEPTLFKVTELSENYMKCENPSHDFPQVIIYQRSGSQMTAIIASGVKRMSFTFKRVE